mmetsp:Transcript_42562/g.102585  ORF Transcript_42562/g.102585 Transcript_42562/m.102585 type:complete len:240 (-) Transcript_42562:2014-2733(-)
MQPARLSQGHTHHRLAGQGPLAPEAKLRDSARADVHCHHLLVGVGPAHPGVPHGMHRAAAAVRDRGLASALLRGGDNGRVVLVGVAMREAALLGCAHSATHDGDEGTGVGGDGPVNSTARTKDHLSIGPRRREGRCVQPFPIRSQQQVEGLHIVVRVQGGRITNIVRPVVDLHHVLHVSDVHGITVPQGNTAGDGGGGARRMTTRHPVGPQDADDVQVCELVAVDDGVVVGASCGSNLS